LVYDDIALNATGLILAGVSTLENYLSGNTHRARLPRAHARQRDNEDVTWVTMAGNPSDPRHHRLASGPQLRRLNTLGRLRLVDDASPIRSPEAKATIGAELERLGLSRFPRAGGTSVGQP